MSAAKLEAAQNKKRFLDVFPEMVEELLDTLRVESMPEEVVDWYRKVSFGGLLNGRFLVLKWNTIQIPLLFSDVEPRI